MAHPPELREMMEALIAMPSVSSVRPDHDTSNRPVIDTLAAWLEDLGYALDIQDVDGASGKANLIATLGRGEDGLVLAGHTDTVAFDEGRWTHDPFKLTEADGRLYGLGSADMKLFLALAIEAARALKAGDLRQPLTLLATADEECTMEGAKALGAHGRRLGRYAVIGEPTNLRPVRQHKGILMEAIRLRGRSGHSSDPRLGNNALEGMHAVIQALMDFRAELGQAHRSEDFDVPFPTVNLGHIYGGDNPNRICGQCELHLDLRALPGMDNQALRADLRTRVAAVADERALECEFISLFEGIPAMQTPADSGIVRLAEELSGHASESVAFATEGPYLNRLGTETVILGPGDIAQAHQPDEYLALERIQPMLDILRGLVQRVCIDESRPRET